MASRKHNATAEALLFAVSTRCAHPGCRIPTVGLTTDKKAVKNVQAAHIVPVSPGMARWRPMDVADRDNYSNLVLLCHAHHHLVDKSPRAHEFTEKMLLAWKEEAEHELREKFDGIDRYTFTEIRSMIDLAAERGMEVILAGIDELGTKVDSGTAKILTVLYQQASDKRRDYEAAAMLHTAATRLTSGDFTETVYTLEGATYRLGDFSENVAAFHGAAGRLEDFGLHAFVNAVNDASTAARTLEEIEVDTGPDVRELSQAVARQVAATLDQRNDRRQVTSPVAEEPRFDTKHIFLTGLGLGVVLSVLLIWATVWLTQGP